MKKSAVFHKPNKSASTIANTSPGTYDVYAQVCGPGTFLPNARLRALLDSTPNDALVDQCLYALQRSLKFVDSFQNISGGSETVLVEENVQQLLKIIVKHGGAANQLVHLKLRSEKVKSCLARSMLPEHCLYSEDRQAYYKEVVFVGSEAKGLEASLFKCYPQLLSVCSTSCVEMFRLGLSRELCVVPGLAMTGSCCQICAVYLCEDCFPVLVALTPHLSLLGTSEEQRQIAQWCVRLASFGVDTLSLLQGNMSNTNMQKKTPEVCLNMDGYFAKPIRRAWKLLSSPESCVELYSNRNMRLNHIMRIYERLRVKSLLRTDEDLRKSCVLFPAGVVAIPGELAQESKDLRALLIDHCTANGFGTEILSSHTPVILFPLLPSSLWSTEKPPELLRDAYLRELYKANKALDDARVAHLDERPANIMWRANGDKVELRLIDFEDAVFFGDFIPHPFVEYVVLNGDWRYPFKSGDEQNLQKARAVHNDFFSKAVTQWVRSEESDFFDFMEANGEQILLDVLALENRQDKEDNDCEELLELELESLRMNT